MQYQFDDFKSCLNQPFTLELNGSEYRLILVSTDKLANSATVGDRDAFSIVFRGDSNLNLPQQIYRISHEQMGSMDIFIVPIGPDEEGMCYEAVFS